MAKELKTIAKFAFLWPTKASDLAIFKHKRTRINKANSKVLNQSFWNIEKLTRHRLKFVGEQLARLDRSDRRKEEIKKHKKQETMRKTENCSIRSKRNFPIEQQRVRHCNKTKIRATLYYLMAVTVRAYGRVCWTPFASGKRESHRL